MAQSFVIVGAGIIGAATALQLAKAGHHVRVISAGGPDATTSAFGWINASFYLDDDHHRLRAAGIDAWRRLTAGVPLSVNWQGCLCWDMPLAELEQTFQNLQSHDYPVEMMTKSQILAREPAIRDCPDQALYFPTEGAAHSPDLPRQLLQAAQEHGAQVLSNMTVQQVVMRGDQAIGVQTSEGVIQADDVILAAGTGTTKLASSAAINIPMVSRPAYIMRTTPVPAMLNHILATPVGEIRQEPSGQLLMPVAANHQGDSADTLTQAPVAAADATMARLRTMLTGLEDTNWVELIRAERPVPADNQPVVGRVGKGLYAAVLHSGITLGPLVAELIAKEVTAGADNASSAVLAPYRPHRFDAG